MRSSSPETRLSEFIASCTYDELPADIVDTIVRAFTDTIGVTLAGSVAGAGRNAAESAGIDPDEAGAATLLGLQAADAPASVALRTGTAGHALDYDDLSWGLDGHPSVTLVPPLLALADECDASGRDLVTAYAAGFETECAVAAPISPAHYEAGWHATATFGTIGATAAAAHLLDLDAPTVAHALNMAASMPAGLKRNFGSMTKPLHAGLCSRAGVTAARLARDGFTANGTAISGDKGFWALYGPADRDAFTLPESWTLREDGIHIKAYPCCYFTHSAIAATTALVAEGLAPGAVEHVTVEASQGAADALPHADPATGLEGKFSMEYTVASALVRDRVDLATFQDGAIDDPAVQRMRALVDVTVDADLPYDSHAATVRIGTAERTWERRQASPPGTPADPLTDEELRAKFAECAEMALPSRTAEQLYEAVTSLPAHHDAVAAVAGRGDPRYP